MDENRVAGTARNIGGKVEEGFGRVTGDTKSQAEGIVNQAAGAAQDLLWPSGRHGPRHGFDVRQMAPQSNRDAAVHHRAGCGRHRLAPGAIASAALRRGS